DILDSYLCERNIENRISQPGNVDNTAPVIGRSIRRGGWDVNSDHQGWTIRTVSAPVPSHFQMHMSLRQLNGSERYGPPASKPVDNVSCCCEPYRARPQCFQQTNV